MKRLIALILSIVMVIGLLPMTASATLADGVTEKAKVRLVYMQPLVSGDEGYGGSGMQFKVVSGDEIDKTAGKSVYVGIRTEDFANIKEVAEYKKGTYGLNEIGFGLSYNSNYLKYEPTAWVDDEGEEVFMATTVVGNLKSRIQYDGSIIYANTLTTGTTEDYSSIYNANQAGMKAASTTQDTDKGYTHSSIFSIQNQDTANQVRYSGANSDYIAIVEFEFKSGAADLSAGASLVGFTYSPDGLTANSLGFGFSGDVQNYIDDHGGATSSTTQDIRTVIDFVEDPLYPVNHDVTAQAADENGSVTVKKGSATGGMTVKPKVEDGVEYKLAETVTYTVVATPSEGYEFEKWTYATMPAGVTVIDKGDGTLSLTITDATLDSAAIPAITASFKTATTSSGYTITGNDNPANGTYSFTVVDGQTYSNGVDASEIAENAKFTISTTPDADYYAEVTVKDAGDEVVTATNGEYTVTSNMTINVEFKAKTAASGTLTPLPATTSVDLGTSTSKELTVAVGSDVTPAGSKIEYQWFKVVGSVDSDDDSEPDVAVSTKSETPGHRLTDLTTDNNDEKYYCVVTITPPAGNTTHKVGTVTSTVTTLSVTAGANTNKPTVTPVHPTTAGGKGSLTVTGTATAVVEYSSASDFASITGEVTLDTDGVSIENLAPGTYYLRYKATGNTTAGEGVSATIKNRYSITYDEGLYAAATGLTGAPETYLEGAEIDLTNAKYTAVANVTQGDWTTSSGSVASNKITGATGNIEVTAHWSMTVPVTTESTGKTDVTITAPTSVKFVEADGKLKVASAIDVSAPETSGNYAFTGWTVTPTGVTGTIDNASNAAAKYTFNELDNVVAGASIKFSAAYGIITSNITSTAAQSGGTYKYTIDGTDYVGGGGNDATGIEAGEIVTITVTPTDDTYYAEVTVKKGNTNVIVTDNEDGTYTFEMPTGDVSIKVEFDQTEQVDGSIEISDDVEVKLIDGTDTATFSVTTTDPDDADDIEYQWYKVVDNVDGDNNSEDNDELVATSETLTIEGIVDDSLNNTYYYCVATFEKEGYRSKEVTSETAKLTVVPIVKSTITSEDGVNGTYTYTIDGGVTTINGGEDKTDVAERTTVTITAAGATTVTVTKTDGTAADVIADTDDDADTYTFEMPAYGVTINVTYPASAPTYDVTIKADENGAVTVKQGSDEITDTNDVYALTEDVEYTVKAVADARYVFDKWVYGADGTTEKPDYVTENADGTLTITIPADTDLTSIPEIKATFKVAPAVLSTITARDPKNGTYTYSIDGGADIDGGIDTDDVPEGAEVEIDTNPNKNYTATITVTRTGSSSTKVRVSNGKFTMPDYPVTITVTFSRKQQGFGGGSTSSGIPTFAVTYNPAANGRLEDGAKKTEYVYSGATPVAVPDVVAYNGYEFIGWSQDGRTVVDPTTVVIDKNVTFTALYDGNGSIKSNYLKPYAKGYEDGAFRPGNNIIRAEVAAMIARLINGDELPDGAYDASFSDVGSGDWYNKYIGYLEDLGVMNGYEDGTFRPLDTITRSEISAVITRAQKYATIPYNGEFTDVTDEDWAKDYIATLASMGIVTGYEDGSFGTELPLTRAEAVTIINRVLVPSTAIVEFTPNDINGHWAEAAIILAVNEREIIAE